MERCPRLLPLPFAGLRPETSPDHRGTRPTRRVVGECLGVLRKGAIDRVHAAALWDPQTRARVFEVVTQLLPPQSCGRLALQGAKQCGLSQRLAEDLVHDPPCISDGDGECGRASDRRFVFGRIQRGEESSAGGNKARREPLGGSGERDDIVLELGLRRLDAGGQMLGEAAQALGPVISRGTTHWSNSSALSRPSATAASLSVVPST